MGAKGRPQTQGCIRPASARHHLRAWRLYRHLTQKALAKRAGLSVSSVCQIENGTQSYGQETLERLAEAIGCTPGDLLSREPLEHVDEIWRRIPEVRRPLAARALSAFIEDQPRRKA